MPYAVPLFGVATLSSSPRTTLFSRSARGIFLLKVDATARGNVTLLSLHHFVENPVRIQAGSKLVGSCSLMVVFLWYADG